jgi:hypothetical protein
LNSYNCRDLLCKCGHSVPICLTTDSNNILFLKLIKPGSYPCQLAVSNIISTKVKVYELYFAPSVLCMEAAYNSPKISGSHIWLQSHNTEDHNINYFLHSERVHVFVIHMSNTDAFKQFISNYRKSKA